MAHSKAPPETDPDTPSRFIVRLSRAKMPGSCWGRCRYFNVALIETDGREEVGMTSPRARGVRRIVRIHRQLHVGDSARSEGFRVVEYEERVARKLNAIVAARS